MPKTLLLFSIFLLIVIGFGYLLNLYFNNPAILYWAVGLSIFMSIASYWFSDKLVLMMTRAQPVSRQDYPELYEIIRQLAEKSKLPMPKIYIVSDPAPNAFATGRSPRQAVVAVTSGLLGRLNRQELEGVLAHELSHIKNYDMLVSTAAVILAGFISIASDILMRSAMFGGLGRRDDRSGAGVIVMVMVIVGAILAPIAALLLRLAVSRQREFGADASGARLIGKSDGLATALIKISEYPQALRSANNTTAHLWFANPFRGRGIWQLFLTHPPVEERIAALRRLAV